MTSPITLARGRTFGRALVRAQMRLSTGCTMSSGMPSSRIYSVASPFCAHYYYSRSFIGYSNANYALSEVRDPVRTIKRAAPLAMFAVSAVYLFINVAYFAVVSKTDILDSRRIVAYVNNVSLQLLVWVPYLANGYLQRVVFQESFWADDREGMLVNIALLPSSVLIQNQALSSFIALSTLGNLLAGQFSQGRVIQELGREGILPYSSVFASNQPFDAPLAGMFTQYLVSCAFLFAVPPGDAYLFLISCACHFSICNGLELKICLWAVSSYSLSLVNTAVALGLLLLYTRAYRSWDWSPPFRAPKLIIALFLVSNLFLVLLPFFPPTPISKTYEKLPYWVSAHSHAHEGLSLIILHSRILLVAYASLWLALYTGTSGAGGCLRAKGIGWCENGSFRRMASRGARFARSRYLQSRNDDHNHLFWSHY